MNRSMVDLWVGIFVAAGFAALLFLALKVGNLATFSTNDTYQVHAKFANIGGLKVRGPVKSAGVVVGRVAESLPPPEPQPVSPRTRLSTSPVRSHAVVVRRRRILAGVPGRCLGTGFNEGRKT